MSKENVKNAEYASTQSRYVDSDGVEFSAQEIVEGFKPKYPYKIVSISEQVSDPSFGKVKRNE